MMELPVFASRHYGVAQMLEEPQMHFLGCIVPFISNILVPQGRYNFEFLVIAGTAAESGRLVDITGGLARSRIRALDGLLLLRFFIGVMMIRREIGCLSFRHLALLRSRIRRRVHDCYSVPARFAIPLLELKCFLDL